MLYALGFIENTIPTEQTSNHWNSVPVMINILFKCLVHSTLFHQVTNFYPHGSSLRRQVVSSSSLSKSWLRTRSTIKDKFCIIPPQRIPCQHPRLQDAEVASIVAFLVVLVSAPGEHNL